MRVVFESEASPGRRIIACQWLHACITVHHCAQPPCSTPVHPSITERMAALQTMCALLKLIARCYMCSAAERAGCPLHQHLPPAFLSRRLQQCFMFAGSSCSVVRQMQCTDGMHWFIAAGTRQLIQHLPVPTCALNMLVARLATDAFSSRWLHLPSSIVVQHGCHGSSNGN